MSFSRTLFTHSLLLSPVPSAFLFLLLPSHLPTQLACILQGEGSQCHLTCCDLYSLAPAPTRMKAPSGLLCSLTRSSAFRIEPGHRWMLHPCLLKDLNPVFLISTANIFFSLTTRFYCNRSWSISVCIVHVDSLMTT